MGAHQVGSYHKVTNHWQFDSLQKLYGGAAMPNLFLSHA